MASFSHKESPVRTVQIQDEYDTDILLLQRRRDIEASEMNGIIEDGIYERPSIY